MIINTINITLATPYTIKKVFSFTNVISYKNDHIANVKIKTRYKRLNTEMQKFKNQFERKLLFNKAHTPFKFDYIR